MQFIEIKGLSKSFVSNDPKENKCDVVIENLTLSLISGEIYTMFGPNGCGKTTLLNLLAGLTEPDNGTIKIEGKNPSPGQAAYMFQNFKDALFPWRTVEGNLLFPLECYISEERERHRLLHNFVQEYEFPIPLKSRVYELSSGQQQMIALARSLIIRPRFLLLDEPFSALDFHMRRFMQERMLHFWSESGATILLVSHEIDEAIYLGQRLILFPPRPIAAVREIPILLPLPRRRDVFFKKEYFNIRSEVLHFFEQDAKRDE